MVTRTQDSHRSTKGQDYPCTYGDYILLERLGVGGMSEVDLARKRSEEEFVRFLVIKRIKADRTDDEAFVRMFKDEARITSELHHNNIAQIYDFGRCGDEYYMALEYVPGLDVRRIINTLRQRRQRVPVRIALRIIYDVLQALDYAHTKVDQFGKQMDIVHRDVNPRNIMVSIRGETKLIDFGVAKATGRLERTKTDHVKGKFAYMAPEQVTTRSIDGRADLFAVGLTLHELITGYGPFHGLSQVQIMHRLIAGRIPALARAPEEFRDPDLLKKVHGKSLEVDPGMRYAKAADFARDVDNLAAPMGGLATQEEVVRFLGYVDPDLVESVRGKMEEYAQPLDLDSLTEATTAPGAPAPSEFTGTLSGVGEMPTGGSATVTRTIIAAGGAFAGGMVGVGAIAIVALGGLVAWKWDVMFPGPSASVADADPAIEAPADIDAAVDPPVEAGSDDAVVDAVADPPVPDRPPVKKAGNAKPIRNTAPAEPDPDKIVVVVPSGDADPPADEGSAEAAPDPPAEPDPVVTVPDEPTAPVITDTGTVQVTSGEKGRAITIDGKPSGEVTPASVDLPVGNHTIEVEGYDAQTVDVRKNQRKPLIFR